ncbi:Vesicle-associated protein 2-1 [Sesamum angolense]|uniref:Vesicle-associated protein 2-1 n=1 Tax=Sesamum angolense TaxID=2727404 RepID=A0AAE1WWM1_9LAMI|nr:Vesicle-associated protein 2-1 [Sesamum angolense]
MLQNQGLQRLKDERDEAVRQTKQLQQDLEILNRRRSRKNMPSLSIKFSLLVGVIGITVVSLAMAFDAYQNKRAFSQQ